ncbi:MAG: glycoside hydrolase family 3 protein [Chlamydiales bacterium]
MLFCFLFGYETLCAIDIYQKDPFIDNLISKMTIEEKVGQLLIVHFQGEECNEIAKILIEDLHIGGIIYYGWANNLSNPEKVRELSQSLQKCALETPLALELFIAIDQEGGSICRLKEGFTVIPSSRAIGMSGDPFLAQIYSSIIAKELMDVGVNMNFAPVVDVNNDGVLRERCFANDPKIVTAFAKAAIKGYQDKSVIPTIKHYPGYGNVSIDPHVDLPTNGRLLKDLEKIDLWPFFQLASQVDAIMTAHILVPALDPKHCATLSSKILSYLRNTMGFKGLIISDSLVMKGIQKGSESIDEIAIRAFNAGCDILLLGGKQLLEEKQGYELNLSDLQKIHRSIVCAVTAGIISESKLNEAVARILQIKIKYLKRKSKG